MYSYSYLTTATAIVEMYNGEVPLAIHLKSYFKLNKKFGSKDRKYIAQLCYSYYRTGNLFKKNNLGEAITNSLFLCSASPNALLEGLSNTLNSQSQLPIIEKLALVSSDSLQKIFPLLAEVTTEIDQTNFLQNQLQQPNLYIRLRPKYLAQGLLILQKLNITYTIIDPYTIQLPNGFKVAEHFVLDKEVVVQDYASQKVLDSLLATMQPNMYYKVWDCCAASGGKSILLHDLYKGKLDMFVTDVRESILENLEKRFIAARITNYKLAAVNLYKKALQTDDEFNIIICDAPCSGSGTWCRTPEQIRNFKIKELANYTTTQKNIATNAAKSLQTNGYFVYITCSVFVQENEMVVTHVINNTTLTLLHQQYIHGYNHHADTMYIALLQRVVAV